MTRHVASADEIHLWLQGHIKHISRGSTEHCKEVIAPTPTPLREPDPEGCNWTISTFPGLPPECERLVLSLVARARARFNLQS